MKLEYKINEQDFLDFQLFTASKSNRINRKKRNGWIFLTAGSFIAAIYFYLKQDIVLAIYLALLTIAWGFYYPKYFKWRYKVHYKKYIKENFANRFGETVFLEIIDNIIYSKDKTGEGKINLTEVEKIDETNNHFFVKISSGVSLIIPKKEIENVEELRTEFKKMGLILNDEQDWRWK